MRAAIDQLAGMDVSEDAIHEARKSVKKVRAVLQLLGGDLDADGGLKRLRRAGRLLAPLRDADALLTTARELCARQPLSERTCNTLRDGLRGCGFEFVDVKPTPTRLALTAWARAPR